MKTGLGERFFVGEDAVTGAESAQEYLSEAQIQNIRSMLGKQIEHAARGQVKSRAAQMAADYGLREVYEFRLKQLVRLNNSGVELVSAGKIKNLDTAEAFSRQRPELEGEFHADAHNANEFIGQLTQVISLAYAGRFFPHLLS